MKAMIFAAGLGTRFKPWTDHHPKALAPVNGKSLLQRNIEYLQQYGISDVLVNVHHFSEQIIGAIEQHQGWGSNISISDESNEVLETGGGLMKARTWLESDEPFLTINADILTDLPLDLMTRYHLQQDALVTLAVGERKSSRVFLFDETLRLCGWENRQTAERKVMLEKSGLLPKAYNCVALYQPGIFDLIPQRGKFSLTETFLSLCNQHRIMGFEQEGIKFIDVGKPESVAIAEGLFE